MGQPSIRIPWSSWFIYVFPTFKRDMITGRYCTVLRKASLQWKMETHAQSQSKERVMRMMTTYAGKGERCCLARDLEVLTLIGPLWQPGEASGSHLRMIFLMKWNTWDYKINYIKIQGFHRFRLRIVVPVQQYGPCSAKYFYFLRNAKFQIFKWSFLIFKCLSLSTYIYVCYAILC